MATSPQARGPSQKDPRRDFAEGEEESLPGAERDFAEGEEETAPGEGRDFGEGQEKSSD